MEPKPKTISEIVGEEAIKEAIAEAEKRRASQLDLLDVYNDKYLICDTASSPWKVYESTSYRHHAARLLKRQRVLEALYLINHWKLGGWKLVLSSLYYGANKYDEDLTTASAVIWCLDRCNEAREHLGKAKTVNDCGDVRQPAKDISDSDYVYLDPADLDDEALDRYIETLWNRYEYAPYFDPERDEISGEIGKAQAEQDKRDKNKVNEIND